MVLMLFQHAVALEAAAVTQVLYDLHQADFTGKDKRETRMKVYKKVLHFYKLCHEKGKCCMKVKSRLQVSEQMQESK